MLKTLYLIDLSQRLTDAWQQVFADFDGIEVVHGDFFSMPADAMVSPANSFGFMDGGLDLAIRHELGFDVETRVQRAIVERFHGELPVGAAVTVATGHARWPRLIAAPTMRIPENIAHTLNPYLAFRAVLLEVKRLQASGEAIESIVCPGLGTGIGQVDPMRCAALMRVAYLSLTKPARIPSYHDIHTLHAKMKLV